MSILVLELSNELNDLLIDVRNMYKYARKNDCFFNPDNYIWLIGRNTIHNLQCCFDPYTTFDGREEIADFLRNIRIEIDHFNPDSLSLYKKIK